MHNCETGEQPIVRDEAMTNEKSNCESRYEQMRREHEELREILGTVGRTLAKRMETVANVAEMLSALIAHVETHFQEEEVAGFFDEVKEQIADFEIRLGRIGLVNS